MADKKGRKDPVQTIGIAAGSGKAAVTPLRPAGTQRPQTPSAGKFPAAELPTDEQIAQRAWAIWVRGGCLPGQDRENWYEAERQLKTELGIQ